MPARWRPEVGDKAAAICRRDAICWAPRCRHRPRGRRATSGLVLAQGLPLVALAHLRGTAPSVQGGPARKDPALSGTGSGGADHGPRDAARGTVRARGGGVGGQLPCGREWEARPAVSSGPGAPGRDRGLASWAAGKQAPRPWRRRKLGLMRLLGNLLWKNERRVGERISSAFPRCRCSWR